MAFDPLESYFILFILMQSSKSIDIFMKIHDQDKNLRYAPASRRLRLVIILKFKTFLIVRWRNYSKRTPFHFLSQEERTKNSLMTKKEQSAKLKQY